MAGAVKEPAVLASIIVGSVVFTLLVLFILFTFTRHRRQRAHAEQEMQQQQPLPDVYRSQNAFGDEDSTLSIGKKAAMSLSTRSRATTMSRESSQSLAQFVVADFPLPPVGGPTPPPSARLPPGSGPPGLETKDLPILSQAPSAYTPVTTSPSAYTPTIATVTEGYPTSTSSELHQVAGLIRGLDFATRTEGVPPVPRLLPPPPPPPPTPSALARLPPLRTSLDRNRKSIYTTATGSPISPASELQHVQRLVRGLSFLPRRGPSRTASRSSLGTLGTINTFTTTFSGLQRANSNASDRDRESAPKSKRQSTAASSIAASVLPTPHSLAPPTPRSPPVPLIRNNSKNPLRRPLWDTEPSPRWDQVEFLKDDVQLRVDTNPKLVRKGSSAATVTSAGGSEWGDEMSDLNTPHILRTTTLIMEADRPKLLGPRKPSEGSLNSNGSASGSGLRPEPPVPKLAPAPSPRRAIRNLPPLPQKQPWGNSAELDAASQRSMSRRSSGKSSKSKASRSASKSRKSTKSSTSRVSSPVVSSPVVSSPVVPEPEPEPEFVTVEAL
ncbi:hypothetical protein MKEN_01062800 [Mycena kentingensis (nom. inval.)]|nr:hypothetical protein MKEN_01062800 [Mycena kentingensis (nom. inval.)]